MGGPHLISWRSQEQKTAVPLRRRNSHSRQSSDSNYSIYSGLGLGLLLQPKHFGLSAPFITFFQFLFFFFFFFCFFRATPAADGSSQARSQIRAALLAYSTALGTQDLSHICDLHHSSWKCWILNPRSEARDRTHILIDTSQVQFPWATMGIPQIHKIIYLTIYQSPIISQSLSIHLSITYLSSQYLSNLSIT